MWDSVALDKETIPTVIELIDNPQIIEMLAQDIRRHWVETDPPRLLNPSPDPDVRAIEEQLVKASNTRFGDAQATKAKKALKKAIRDARKIFASSRLESGCAFA